MTNSQPNNVLWDKEEVLKCFMPNPDDEEPEWREFMWQVALFKTKSKEDLQWVIQQVRNFSPNRAEWILREIPRLVDQMIGND